MFFLKIGVVLFYYFYTKCCVLAECRTKSDIAEQNLQNFYNFCAALLILCTTVNFARVIQFCAKFCVCRITQF